MLQSVADVGLMMLKLIAFITFVSVFSAAIKTFIGLFGSVLFPDVVGEVLGLASMYLPFNALAVFDAIATALSSILTFMIARKVFNLVSDGFSVIS